MLPGARRLRRPAEFSAVFSSRVRAASPSVVVHVARSETDTPPDSTRVGFVVSKKVGNAVHRNRVKRRLRHLCRELPWALPASGVLVVRALPASSGASYAQLSADLEHCLRRIAASPSGDARA